MDCCPYRGGAIVSLRVDQVLGDGFGGEIHVEDVTKGGRPSGHYVTVIPG